MSRDWQHRYGLLGSIVFLVSLACCSKVCAQLPGNEAEWSEFGGQLQDLFRKRCFASMLEYEESHGSALLDLEPGHYESSVYMAKAFLEAGQNSKSLLYFEKAFQVECQPQDLKSYTDAAHDAGEIDRWDQTVAKLVQSEKISRGISATFESYSTFLQEVDRGDLAYINGDLQTAETHWRNAKGIFEEKAARAGKDYASVPLSAARKEYTYQQLYLSQYGLLRKDFLVEHFLEPKLALCEPLSKPDSKAVDFRVTAFVVKDTDLQYRSADGRQHRERLRLTDAEGKRYQAAWKLATDALHHYSGGKVKVRTRWKWLKGAVFTELKVELWNEMVAQRLADPASIVPPQDEAFREAVKYSDAVMFVWPRGLAAESYGGGSMTLPLSDGRFLPKRGSIRSLSTDPTICLHELLHVVEEQIETEPVHGPRGLAMLTFERLNIEDEIDWYRHLISGIREWDKLPFR